MSDTTLSDSELMARHEARQRVESVSGSAVSAAPTPVRLAEMMRDGYVPPDSLIRSWRERAPVLWSLSIDPEHRAQLLAPVAPRRAPAAHASREPEPPGYISRAFARLERVLLSPVTPILDGRGNFLGAHRELPLDLDAEPEPPPAPAPAPARKADLRSSMEPATVRALMALSDATLPRIGELIEIVNELQTRLIALESAGGVRSQTIYMGVWSAEFEYPAGAFATHGGSMWHANVTSTGIVPGTDSAWTLAVKRGKDAR